MVCMVLINSSHQQRQIFALRKLSLIVGSVLLMGTSLLSTELIVAPMTAVIQIAQTQATLTTSAQILGSASLSEVVSGATMRAAMG
jgi:hypothetical protein